MTAIEIFEEARKLYPGTKLGLAREFAYFKKKNKDWREVLPLLMPAIHAQIEWRQTSEWRPQWKGFSVWTNNGQWELELPRAVLAKLPKCLCCPELAVKVYKNKGLCHSCMTLWYKTNKGAWDVYTTTEIELAIENAKTDRPREKTKPKEMINADRQRKLINDLAQRTFG